MTAKIRRFAILPVLALAGAVAGGCDDDPTAARATLTGDFEATDAVFTDAANANTTFDLIGQGGSLDMSFGTDGTFTSNLAVPDRDPVLTTGTFQVQGSDILFTSGGVTNTVGFTRTGGTLTLANPATEFDFGTGTAVAARMDATLQQR